jgi:hypothetical protein
MLIKIKDEGNKIFDLSFGSEEPEVIVKRFTGSADRARIAAAEAARIAAGIWPFMELSGGEATSSSDYYDQKYIDELSTIIKTYETNIKNLNNLINQNYTIAEKSVINKDKNNLDINNNLAEENLKKN